MKKPTLILLLLSAWFCLAGDVPKNIILFIGDGMGPSQVTAGKVTKGTLEMERCPVAAFVTTWSANKLVTDSAASGTALATGVKTKNGMISQDPDGDRLKTVLEVAEENGKSSGLAVNCAVTHATPAAFDSHVPSRKQYTDIADQLAASDVDVLFGGGLDHFSSESLALLQEKMPVAKTAEEFHSLGTPKKAAALLYPVHPPYAAERTVSLPELTSKALEILAQDPDGFFLMVEGSQIDWAGHKNDGTNIVSEVVDFDNAVGVGLDFAQKTGDTLVLITADHETAGFAVLDGSINDHRVDKTGFVYKKHTASMIPLFAFGPGSDAFGGIMDNTDIGKTMIRLIQTPAE